MAYQQENFSFEFNKDLGMWSANAPTLDTPVNFEQGVVSLVHQHGTRYAGIIHSLHGVPQEQVHNLPATLARRLIGCHVRTNPTSAWRLLPDGKVEKAFAPLKYT